MHTDSLQPGMLVCHPILRSIIRKYSFVLFSQLKVWRIHTTNETCHNSARYSGSNLPFLASPTPSTNHIARDQHLEIAYSSWLLARQMQCKFCKIIFGGHVIYNYSLGCTALYYCEVTPDLRSRERCVEKSRISGFRLP